MDVLHFLNLQYWYCVIFSFFGGRCGYLEELRAAQTIPAAPTGPGAFEQFFSVLASGAGAVWSVLSGIFSSVWNVYSAFAWGFSLFLFLGILFALGGLAFIRMREVSLYGTLPPKTNEENGRGNRWQELLGEAMSADPKRWRFAILEADAMLGELLGNLGYVGATTPDKMRSLPEDAFVTVPVAWEAHRVRNFISHGSSDFILTQREAFRVMKLYEQVFEEFGVV